MAKNTVIRFRYQPAFDDWFALNRRVAWRQFRFLVIIAAGLIGQNDYPSATKYWRRAPERPFSADPIETLIKPTVILSLPSIRSLLSVDRFCGLPCFQIVN